MTQNIENQIYNLPTDELKRLRFFISNCTYGLLSNQPSEADKIKILLAIDKELKERN